MMMVLFLIGTMGLFAQTMQTTLSEATKVVIQVEEELDMEIVNITFDLTTSTEWKWTYRDLYTGWNYVIYAAGQMVKVADMDLRVMKKNANDDWETIEEDVLADFSAAVAISPEVTERYAIGVKVAEFEDGYTACNYYILIAHE